jgi:hypothetical protein
MHESLKRPLFRKKAMEVYQAKQGGKVPGYVIGGLIPPIMAGVRTAGPFIARQFARPNVQKGLAGLEAAGIGAGIEETKRGIKGEESLFPFNEGDPATISGGLTALVPGVGLLGKTLPKAFPGSLRAQGIGQAMTNKFPFSIPLIPAVGLGTVASFGEGEVRKAVTDEKTSRVEDPKKIEDLSKKLKALGPNASTQQYFDTVDSYEITEKQKRSIYEKEFGFTPGDIDYFRSTKGTTTAQKEKPTELKQAEKDKGTPPPTADNFTQNLGDPNKMSPDEQARVAVDQVKQMNSATKKVEKLDKEAQANASFKNQFDTLKNTIQGTTGNQDMTNLIIAKMAAGLLTGKTTQKGAAGFLDVLGQASGPAIDTAIALASNQKEFDQTLALSLIKNNAESQGGLKAAQTRVYVQEVNKDDELFPIETRMIPVDVPTGRYIDSVMTPEGERLIEYTKGGTVVEPNKKLLNQADSRLEDQTLTMKYAQIVMNTPDELIGGGARLRAFTDSLLGSAESVKNFGDIDTFKAESFNKISANILNEDALIAEGYTGEKLEKERKIQNELLQQFREESDKAVKELQSAIGTGDAVKIARAQLLLIDQRMPYIIANANKKQDRLTQADVANARKNTALFEIISNPGQIKKNYGAIYNNTEVQFREQFKKAAANGHTRAYLMQMYGGNPVIQEYLAKREAKEKKQDIKKDYKTTLGTI